MAVASQITSELVFPELQPARQEGVRHRRLARHRPGLRADAGRGRRRRRRRLEPQRRRGAPRRSAGRSARWDGASQAYAFDVGDARRASRRCARA